VSEGAASLLRFEFSPLRASNDAVIRFVAEFQV
jgi:hypothetical protein